MTLHVGVRGPGHMSRVGPPAAAAILGSVAFDGTGDYLSLAADAALAFEEGDYTVECWVRVTSISASTLQVLFASGTTSSANFYFHLDGDQISVGTQLAFVSNQTTTFSTDTWYHVAACRSGTTLRLFRNGVQVGSDATDSTVWLSDGAAQIGVGTASDYVFGNISNLRVEKGFARYTADFTPPTAPLGVTASTSLLTCQGDAIRDNSANGFTVTANGNAGVSALNPF